MKICCVEFSWKKIPDYLQDYSDSLSFTVGDCCITYLVLKNSFVLSHLSLFYCIASHFIFPPFCCFYFCLFALLGRSKLFSCILMSSFYIHQLLLLPLLQLSIFLVSLFYFLVIFAFFSVL